MPYKSKLWTKLKLLSKHTRTDCKLLKFSGLSILTQQHDANKKIKGKLAPQKDVSDKIHSITNIKYTSSL